MSGRKRVSSWSCTNLWDQWIVLDEFEHNNLWTLLLLPGKIFNFGCSNLQKDVSFIFSRLNSTRSKLATFATMGLLTIISGVRAIFIFGLPTQSQCSFFNIFSYLDVEMKTGKQHCAELNWLNLKLDLQTTIQTRNFKAGALVPFLYIV